MKRVFILVGLTFAVTFATIASAYTQAETSPGTVILKGSPLGGVKYNRAKHAKLPGTPSSSATTHPSPRSPRPRRTSDARRATRLPQPHP